MQSVLSLPLAATTMPLLHQDSTIQLLPRQQHSCGDWPCAHQQVVSMLIIESAVLDCTYTEAILLMCVGGAPFSLHGRVKAHARILWGVAWSSDSALFVTASRDCSVKLWRPENCAGAGRKALASLPILPSAVTALAMAQGDHPDCHLLAVGLETGVISLWSVPAATISMTCLWQAPVHLQHGAAVRRLAFQELDQQTDGETRTLHLASCSDDHTVRVFSVSL